MPLSPAEIALLSRLLDEAEGVAPESLEAWLAALPPAQARLVPELRRMLALQGTALGALPAWPALHDLPGDAAPDARAGDRLGPYRLLREIGRGGMGTVWLAERADGLYARQVALKLPRASLRPGLARRMAGEREIAARLEHPHIARLYDAGIDDAGRPYLVMEHVDGLPLAAWAARHAPGRDACLRLVLQACDAVAHAHRQLVVHRDIKPSNLMVDAAGQLRLLDFGIARLLGGEGRPLETASDLQRTHTPGYAAPEQLRGEPAGTAADQYALAVVLHELLTGQRPAPGRPAAALGRDLAAVLARALQPRPEARYGSVEHFADELRRVRAREPVHTDPGPWTHRLALLGRRRAGAVAAGSLVALSLAAGGAAAWQQQAVARDEAQRSALAREFLFDLLEDTEPLEGQTPDEAGPAGRVRAALARARNGFADQPALQGDVLVQLGLMLRRVGTPAESIAALREGHAQLAAHADAGDPALARARAQLAQQSLEQDPVDLDAAATLARAAIDGCRRDALRCAKARAYAERALMQVALRRGEADAALGHAQATVQAHAQAFGPDDPETALARLQLAIALRNGGRLPEAAAALAPALAAAAGLRLRAADRAQLRQWEAVIAADLGRHADALQALDALLAAPAGPGARTASHASDRATWLRLRAQSQHALQRWPAALADAEAAITEADVADDRWERALARQARGRTLSALGRHGEAHAELGAVEGLLAGLGLAETSLERLRLRRLQAEAALRAGDVAAAAEGLAPLPAAHGAATGAPRGPVDLAQVLDLQGAVARAQGDTAAARARHAEAAPLLAALPPAHPLRRRHDIDRALAEVLAGASPATLQAAVRAWLEELPADAGGRAALARLMEAPGSGRGLVF